MVKPISEMTGQDLLGVSKEVKDEKPKFNMKEEKEIEELKEDLKKSSFFRKLLLRSEMLMLEPVGVAIPEVKRLLEIGKEAFRRAKKELEEVV